MEEDTAAAREKLSVETILLESPDRVVCCCPAACGPPSGESLHCTGTPRERRQVANRFGHPGFAPENM
ncbi:hypothetical protein [Burkholderia sp. IMCC1007]|uniref:hypothetical protein n=1 Tax=Burkholderia sp. IMCC1007 TaxID=3004104 RepID=UPI0022B390CC|nr:hypothetical protein [Burkholderia sp. IMCC1007]